MRNSKIRRRLAILATVGAGLAVAVVVARIEIFKGQPHAFTPPTSFSNRPNVSPPPPPGRRPTPVYPAGLEYEGPLGDFLVTPMESATSPSCPEPRNFRSQNFKTSELYSPMFGENPEAVECGDGKIIGIFVTPIWGRRYFVGPAKVPWTCPFNQLELLTVGGRPAIAQLDPACPGGLRLAVIERVPNNNEPGILVVIDSSSRSPEETAALAAQIMGVRP